MITTSPPPEIRFGTFDDLRAATLDGPYGYINFLSLYRDPDGLSAWVDGDRSFAEQIVEWFEDLSPGGRTLVLVEPEKPLIWLAFESTTDAVMTKLAWSDFSGR